MVLFCTGCLLDICCLTRKHEDFVLVQNSIRHMLVQAIQFLQKRYLIVYALLKEAAFTLLVSVDRNQIPNLSPVFVARSSKISVTVN